MRNPTTWLVVLCGLHIFGVAGLIGYGHLLHDRPVVDGDLGMHFYRAALLRESGSFPGLMWDPGYMGGYVLGGATDVDNRLGELGVFLLRFLPAGMAWNWTLLILFSAVPTLLFLAARWSDAERRVAVVAAALGVLLFWTMLRGDYEFLEWGMYGWVILCSALPLVFAGVHRSLDKPGYLSAMSLGLAGALAAYANGLSALYLPFLVLVLVSRGKQVRARHLATLSGAILITGILVWPIARPVILTLAETRNPAGLAVYFQATLSEVLAILGSPHRAFGHGLLLLCVVGMVFKRLSRPHVELTLAALVTTAVSLFGFMLLPPSSLQPTRNVEPALFLAAVPASQMLVHLSRYAKRWGPVERLSVLGLLLALIAPVCATWAFSAVGQRSYTTEPSAEAAALVRYLRQHTTPDARVLIEDDGDFFGGNHFGPPHLVGYLAREVGRELIGGPHPVTFVRVGATTFVNGKLLGRSIESFDDAELDAILESYNIGTAVVWSRASRNRFLRLGLAGEDLAGGFTVFQTGRSAGFVVGAESAKATARPNAIHVTGAATSPTLLRWQYDPRFVTEPALPIRSERSPYSTVGFLVVDNGATSEFLVRFVD